MASYALPNDLLTNYPMPTDRVRVPQGYGRVDDTDLVYDRPRNTRRDHDELSDEFLIGVLHGLDLTDVSQRHTFIDAYCRPANDRRAYDQLPQELVNGLKNLDIADTDQVRGFIDQRCRPALHGREYAPIREELVLRELQDLDVRDTDELVAFLDAHGMVNFDTERPEEWAHLSSRVPIRQIQESLQLIQLLAAHLATASLGGDLVALWTPSRRVNDDAECWHLFLHLLDDVLSRAHAHPRVERVFYDGMIRVGGPEHDLVDALCLQLLQLMHDELPVRECANERCDQFFVRQRGRSNHGQYRTRGTKYCSGECANAQAQRQSRRRKRAKAVSDNAAVRSRKSVDTDPRRTSM